MVLKCEHISTVLEFSAEGWGEGQEEERAYAFLN